MVDSSAVASRDSDMGKIEGRVLSHGTIADIVAKQAIFMLGNVPIEDGEGMDADTGFDKLVFVHLKVGVCKELAPRMSLMRTVAGGKHPAIDECIWFTSCGLVCL